MGEKKTTLKNVFNAFAFSVFIYLVIVSTRAVHTALSFFWQDVCNVLKILIILFTLNIRLEKTNLDAVLGRR